MKRRGFVTTMGALPFLPGLLPAAAGRQSKKSLIMIWMDGGMSHIDTFDGKPEAPSGIRGDLVCNETSLEGVFFSEHLPRLSRLMKKMTLVRSITSPEGNHDRGSCYMLTGRRPNPVLTYPSFGSVYGGTEEGALPPYVAIPDAHYYAREGFLPLTKGPFELGGSPGVQNFRVKNLNPHPQLERALELLRKVDALDGAPQSSAEVARDQFLAQARDLSLNAQTRELFDVSKEKEATRQRYGRHFLGQSCLLARRLVEGGVGTVFVRFKGWDDHQKIATAMTYGWPPKLEAMDEAVAALHDDLEARGMLENTMVVVASEFGRTPRINGSGGRDHWSRASSVLLFGSGLKPGCVYGSTDAKGESPLEDPVTPGDLFCTILAGLGADLERKLSTADGRPIPLVEEEMKVIREIFA